MKKAGTFIANTFYTILVVVVVAIALLFLGTKIDILGYEAKIVKSGSMEPAITTGSIVIIAPSATYNVGDVVTFGRDTRRSVPVTHRVIEKTGEGNTARYLTKGDANEDSDSRSVSHRSIIGKVVLSIPYLGYVIEFARTPWGYALLVGIPAAIIVLDEFADIMWEFHKYRLRKRKGPVGYRVPSRERVPKERAQKAPVLIPPARVRGKQFVNSPRDFVLDLRHYRRKRYAV